MRAILAALFDEKNQLLQANDPAAAPVFAAAWSTPAVDKKCGMR